MIFFCSSLMQHAIITAYVYISVCLLRGIAIIVTLLNVSRPPCRNLLYKDHKLCPHILPSDYFHLKVIHAKPKNQCFVPFTTVHTSMEFHVSITSRSRSELWFANLIGNSIEIEKKKRRNCASDLRCLKFLFDIFAKNRKRKLIYRLIIMTNYSFCCFPYCEEVRFRRAADWTLWSQEASRRKNEKFYGGTCWNYAENRLVEITQFCWHT